MKHGMGLGLFWAYGLNVSMIYDLGGLIDIKIDTHFLEVPRTRYWHHNQLHVEGRGAMENIREICFVFGNRA